MKRIWEEVNSYFTHFNPTKSPSLADASAAPDHVGDDHAIDAKDHDQEIEEDHRKENDDLSKFFSFILYTK